MIVYVLTCDKYDHLLPGFAHQFQKYWRWGKQQHVTAVGFREPPELPHNFTFKSIAPVETKPWCEHIHDFITQHAHQDHFVLLLDDYWMTSPLDPEVFRLLELPIFRGKVQKVDLSLNTKIFGSFPRAGKLLEANQHAKYRTSLQPAIWNREYFLQYCRPGWGIWDFETKGMHAAKNDAASIVQWNQDTRVYEYANIYHKGTVNRRQVAQLSWDDLLTLRKAGHADFIPEFASRAEYEALRKCGSTAFKQ